MKKVTQKKYELEISTLEKIFVGQNFSWVTKIFSHEKFWPMKILSDIFLSDKVKKSFQSH